MELNILYAVHTQCFTLDLTLLLLRCFLKAFLCYQLVQLELVKPCVSLEDAEEMRHLQWPTDAIAQALQKRQGVAEGFTQVVVPKWRTFGAS